MEEVSMQHTRPHPPAHQRIATLEHDLAYTLERMALDLEREARDLEATQTERTEEYRYGWLRAHTLAHSRMLAAVAIAQQAQALYKADDQVVARTCLDMAEEMWHMALKVWD